MLQYPNSPKVYRALRDMYQNMGKHHEAQAFKYLLEIKFKELSDDNNNNTNEKS